MRTRVSALALFAALALLGGCKSAPPPVKATLAEVDADAVVLDVTTKPDVRVSTSYGDEGSPADASGHARIRVSRREWASWWGDRITVVAHASRTTNETSFALPVPLSALVRIPANQPSWVAYLGGDPIAPSSCKVESRVTFELEGGPPIVRGEGRDDWCIGAAGRKVALSVPPGAHLDFAGASVDAPTGLTEVDLDLDALAGSVVLTTLETKKPAVELAAKVRTKDGTTSTTTFRLHAASWHDVPTWLAGRLDRIEKGTPLPGTGSVDALVVRDPDGKLSSIGAEGTLRDARWVALEKGTRRSVDSRGSNCVLHDWEDYDVTILDAHTGAKLGARKFKAADAPCEGWFSPHAGKERVVPDDAVVDAWLRSGMKTGTWK